MPRSAGRTIGSSSARASSSTCRRILLSCLQTYAHSRCRFPTHLDTGAPCEVPYSLKTLANYQGRIMLTDPPKLLQLSWDEMHRNRCKPLGPLLFALATLNRHRNRPRFV